MLRIIVLFFVVLMISNDVAAQHCPYDGMHLVAIQVIDKGGRLPAGMDSSFYLQEVDNPMADSCAHAKGLLQKRFLPADGFVAAYNKQYNRNGYNKDLDRRLKEAGVFARANMMLSLNQAENTCTYTGKSETVYTNYIYRQRKFVIVYTVNGKEMRTPLPEAFIYGVCTASRELEHFKPVTITVDQ